MKIAYIHSNDGSDIRVGKTCRSLARLGHEVHYIGWDRRPDEPKDVDLGGASMHLMQRETRFGKATVMGQLAFGWFVVRRLARLRPRVACAVNEDLAVMLLPFKYLLYRYLVCDVYDALVDRHSHRSAPLRGLLRLVSRLVRRRADRLIATDAARHARFGKHRQKTVVVENAPEDPGARLSLQLPEGPVRIWAAGALFENRGLRMLLEAVRPLEGVSVLSAGWTFDAYAKEEFVTDPKVDFRGIVRAPEALELAAQCDAVLCCYNPTTVNNVNASPNKIYDAMAIGRPVIVNREIAVARWVAENDLGFCVPYGDVEALRRVIVLLVSRRGELPAFARHARDVFQSRFSWEQMEGRLAVLYGGLK